jgi:hypothetical protein
LASGQTPRFSSGGGYTESDVSAFPPPELKRGVWPLAKLRSQNALDFEAFYQSWPAAVRPEAGDAKFFVGYSGGQLKKGKYKVVAFVAFLDGPEAANAVEVTMQVSLNVTGQDPPFKCDAVTQTLTYPDGGPPQAMQVFECDFDTAQAGSGDCKSWGVDFTLKVDAVDPAHPPVILGLRVIPTLPV